MNRHKTSYLYFLLSVVSILVIIFFAFAEEVRLVALLLASGFMLMMVLLATRIYKMEARKERKEFLKKRATPTREKEEESQDEHSG
jgi:uncharacterized membrane protein YqjE